MRKLQFRKLKKLTKVFQLGNGSQNSDLSEVCLSVLKLLLIAFCYPGSMESTWALEADQSFVQVCHVIINELINFSETVLQLK